MKKSYKPRVKHDLWEALYTTVVVLIVLVSALNAISASEAGNPQALWGWTASVMGWGSVFFFYMRRETDIEMDAGS